MVAIKLNFFQDLTEILNNNTHMTYFFMHLKYDYSNDK